MKGLYHCDIFLSRKLSQKSKQPQLVVDIEEGSRLVQQENVGLLRYRPREHDALPLSVAYLAEIGFGKVCHARELHRFIYRGFVLLREQPQSAGIGVASR